MKVLHLSDPHYGVHPYLNGNPCRLPLDETTRPLASMQSTHQFDNANGEPRPEALIKVLERDQDCRDLDLIVISGDVSWSGTSLDFDYARAFLDGLRRCWPSTPVFLTPGNHDVDRTAGLDSGARQDAFIEFTRKFYGTHHSAMFPWLDSTDDESGLPRRDRVVGVLHVPSKLVAVSVNSAARIMGFGEPSPIHIREGVLEHIEDTLRSPPYDDDLFRLFVVHHHLLPFSEMSARGLENRDSPPEQPDDSIVLNSAKLQSWLAKHRFGAVLHGHKHVGHGRVDTLWRRGTAQGRKLVIIGAGSCGVRERHREQGELLTYNIIDIQREEREAWRISVVVRSISDADLTHNAAPWFRYVTVAGAPTEPPVHVFHGHDTAECHARIALALKGRGRVHNFVSVVEGDVSYKHPPTLQGRESQACASESDVWDSFLSLHPEFDRSARGQEHGWQDARAMEERFRLSVASARYRIDHGSRIFGFDRNGRPQPISGAIDRLTSSRGTRAYLGLYDPATDANTDDTHPPLPGLVGIQFVADDRDLDVVATFRGLELSFWWAVNMLEAGLLLKYAAKQRPGGETYRIRRITFWAALAEWKADHAEPIFVSQIDELSEAQIFVGALDAADGNCGQLLEWLRQKRDNSNVNNIDATGLERLLHSLRLAREVHGRYDVRSPLGPPRLIQLIGAAKDAVESMRAAIDPPAATRADRVERALHALDGFVQLLS